MTAFGAIFHRDGRQVHRSCLERVAAALKPFGAARTGLKCAGAAGLVGFSDGRFVPENALEDQPVSAGQRLVLFDGLLAHRRDLTDALGLEPRCAARQADSALFACAWARWGADAALRVEGKFAAVVWDPRARTLSAVCSPLVAPPLYYAVDRRRVIVASAPRGIFAWGDLARRLDDQVLASNLIGDFGDGRATCYRGVSSLLPGEVLTTSPRAVRTRRYYDLAQRAPPVRLATDDDYMDAADELLQRAVASAMRTTVPPAAALSGGLDSSTAAVTALGLLDDPGTQSSLACFTATNAAAWDGRTKHGVVADERRRVRALARKYPALDVNFFDADGVDTSSLAALHGRMMELLELPQPGIAVLRPGIKMMRLVAQGGHSVLLGGAYGNSSLSHDGLAHLADLFRRGRVPSLLREARGGPRGRRLGRFSPLLHYGLYRNLPRRLHGMVRRLVYGQRGWADVSPVHPRFANAMRVNERGRCSGFDPYVRGHVRVRDALLYRWNRHGRDNLLRAGNSMGEAIWGVQERAPLADRRLVEWCLGIPAEQYLRHGQSRRLIRRLMKDRLPPEILDGPRGQTGLDWHLHATRDLPETRATFERWRHDPDVAERLDLDRALRLVAAWPQETPVSRRDHREYLFLRHGIDHALAAGRFIRWAEGGGNWGAT